jgi:hypothetical protein
MPLSTSWLLLVSSLPGQAQTSRMRVWRALKASGAGALRDGAYLLPASAAARGSFQSVADEVVAAGGAAYLMALAADGPAQEQSFRALFDRREDYAALLSRLDSLRQGLSTLAEAQARREWLAVEREAAAVFATDFFAGPSRAQVEAALLDAQSALNARYSPDEPQAAPGGIPRLDRRDFQARAWATREHLWIDRVCSAWLIRRHIDARAKFLWLRRVKDCPKKAVGFDFDGAQFSHVGGKVSFEVLLASFDLARDPALSRLGALAHYLDVGGVPVPEAAGFAAIMAGARAKGLDDDALLKTMLPVLDNLYAAYAAASE